MPSPRYTLAGFILCALCEQTAFAAAPADSAAAGVPAGGILQVVAGLAAVLALVGAGAWLLKRFSGLRGGGSGLIRIVGGAALGSRRYF